MPKPDPQNTSQTAAMSPRRAISTSAIPASQAHSRQTSQPFLLPDGSDMAATIPAYSPSHQHRRTPSVNREVKETLDARTHYGGGDAEASFYYINQYLIKQEIGRGSYGSVHLAVDQHGTEYAVKEFSKARLRKRAQSNLLRMRSASAGLGQQIRREPVPNPLDLIRGEIAVMKKLNHHNVVALIEVLDDPEEDSLYMVMEMCKKGVVMNVNLGQTAEPYSLEACRCWFRDIILGIEYLHAQGVVHRDIKPDNCLLTCDNVLKIVDFGVSEIFEREKGMLTSKSAGSPAFMPPELCVPKHGEVSGQAADIWSMGVTLYCLRFGRLPFESFGIIELFESILKDAPTLDGEDDPHFRDIMGRILEKDPRKRITMDELRVHPWVTLNGTDYLMSKEENVAETVEAPTDQEVSRAITGRMTKIVTMMKAVGRFKHLLRSRTSKDSPSLSTRLLSPSISYTETMSLRAAIDPIFESAKPVRHVSGPDRIMKDSPVQAEPSFKMSEPSQVGREGMTLPVPAEMDSNSGTLSSKPRLDHQFDIRSHSTNGKGQARDPLENSPFLGIGAGPASAAPDGTALAVAQAELEGGATNPDHLPAQHVQTAYPLIFSDSPTGTEENIFENAFWKEATRIISTIESLDQCHHSPTPLSIPSSSSSGDSRAAADPLALDPPSPAESSSPADPLPRLVDLSVQPPSVSARPVRSSTLPAQASARSRPIMFLTKEVDGSAAVRQLAAEYLTGSERRRIAVAEAAGRGRGLSGGDPPRFKDDPEEEQRTAVGGKGKNAGTGMPRRADTILPDCWRGSLEAIVDENDQPPRPAGVGLDVQES